MATGRHPGAQARPTGTAGGALRAGAAPALAPARVRLRYRVEGAPAASWRPLDCALAADGDRRGNADLEVSTAFDGEALMVTVEPRVRLTVGLCAVDFPCELGGDEPLLLNGYQSWTETRERPCRERMRGLDGVPRAVVRRFSLDGAGDYRFADYPRGRGRQHGFTYLTLRRGGACELLGSLDESDGLTLLSVDVPGGMVSAEKEPPAAPLPAGVPTRLCSLAVVGAGDADAAYARWFDMIGRPARPAAPLVGYTSWYRHYGDIDADGLLHDLDGVAALIGDGTDLGAELADAGARRVFQVDDGYAVVGDWLEPRAERFPGGMAPLAGRVRAAGLEPGLWVAPFVCERGSRLFREHPDWLLRDARGEVVSTGCHWSGGVALDTLNPQVRAWVGEVLRTMTRDWGYALLKCDFLYAACMLPHGGLNRGQLMDDALRLLRDAVGDRVAILACGVPLGSAFGRVEYCRIGCDVSLDWDDRLYMRGLQRERNSTKRSMGDTIARAPLDGRAFGNDSDVFFLRDDVRLSPRRRLELLSTDARLSSVLMTSDDMGLWDAGQRAEYARALRAFVGRRR